MTPAVERFPVDPSMFDAGPVGLGLCDGDNRFIHIRSGLAAILGRRSAEVVGLHYTEIVHPDDRAATHARLVEFMAGGADRLQHEERYLRPDGGVRWVTVLTSRVTDGSGTTASSAVRVIDITDCRQAELERDLATATLAEVQAIAHLGSWEYDFATQQTTCSDELFRIFGLDPATPPPDIKPLFERIHVEDRRALQESAWASFESGAPFSVESRIIRTDGAERIVHVQGRFSANLAGHDRLIGTLQDVTARRRAEVKLRETEERFRAIFESAPMGIATVNGSLRLLNVNAALAGMLDEEAGALVGRSLLDIVYPDDGEQAGELGRKTVAGELPGYDLEQRLVRRDGDILWVRARAAFLREQAGTPRHGFVLIEDITARREAERVWLELDSLRLALLERLSAQEQRILEHVAAGRTNRQIAEELSLAEKTVRNYVSTLLAKLGMHRRTEAAAFAARLEERRSVQTS